MSHGEWRGAAHIQSPVDWLALALEQADRFWSKVRRSGDGCWLWLAGTDNRGQPKFALTAPKGCVPKQKHVRGHRLAYELAGGVIPAEMRLIQACRNRLCVRPTHLALASASDVVPQTHGGRGSPEYDVWASLIQRCTNPKAACYADYGGRGIRVCDRWREDFAAFLSDVGSRPSDKHSIDRINNDGNYEPGNVRWATGREQQRNTRVTVYLEVNGQRRPLADLCEERGLDRRKVSERIRRGWSAKEALEWTP